MRNLASSILTIGDEVTAGQISNRNAHWIAQQMSELGLSVSAHFSCRDNPDEIVDALKYLAKYGAVICVTGGLGPTTDDVTRNAIASFCGKALEFNESSWSRIVAYFRNAGSEPRDTNRQQCFFPTGSEIFPNEHGTADGFCIFDKKSKTNIIALPGPPREMEPMWFSNVASRIKPLTPEESLTTWRLIGIGESALQHEIHKLTPPPKTLRLGYRASMPIVEVKVWQKNGDSSNLEAQTFLEGLEALLQPWIFENHQQNIIQNFCTEVLAAYPKITICDYYTDGNFQRILMQHNPRLHELDFSLHTEFGSNSFAKTQPFLEIRQGGNLSAVMITGLLGKTSVESEIPLPFAASRVEFNKPAVAYLTCKKVLSIL